MAITFTQSRKNQKYLILVFIVIIVVIVFVFFSDSFKKEEVFIGEPVVSTKHLPPIKINFQTLAHPIFQKLIEPFPELPSAPPVGEVGRENPFLPY